jgi:hypothetical protein
MSRDEQTGSGTEAAGGWWGVPLLAVAMGLYVLWMGQGLVLSGPPGKYWFYLAPWWTQTSIKFIGMSIVFGAVCWAGRTRLGRGLPWVFAFLFLGGQLIYAVSAWRVVGGTVPWGFDHPSFMFRLKEFGEVFPGAIGGYNPNWNAGTEHFVGVTSGSHAFGILILPLLKIWDPHVFYGGALIFWFVFAFPWLGAVSARVAGVSRIGALCAGILLCGVSREVFVWIWHFGTVGAMTSAMMVLPVTALGYRLAVLRRGSWGTALALGGSAWLMCLWTPGVFVAGGLALGWLWNAKEWTWKSNRWLLVAGGLALLLLSPWFWTTLFPCSNVIDHVSTDLTHPELGAMLLNGADRLICALEEWHPVVLFLGLVGGLWLVPRPMRRWMTPLFLILALIAGWSREWKPFSQLERMAIPMAVAAVFPAAMLCGRLFDPADGLGSSRRRRIWVAWGQGIVLATFLLGCRIGQMHFANQGPAPLRTLSAQMQDLVEWIHEEVPEEGRLGFAGRAVHFYGGGNIAYLPILTGREMMADDYYGFPRGTIEYNYPPDAYRKTRESYLFFAKTYGITHWVSAMPEAVAFLDANPESFERVKSLVILNRDMAVFRIKEPGPVSRFWKGKGRVTARVNQLRVEPADPAVEEVVIRYNWRDGLVCKTEGASIGPVPVDGNITFIGVRPNGNPQVEIGYRTHASSVKPNFDGHFHH